jgi:hypothetical protein
MTRDEHILLALLVAKAGGSVRINYADLSRLYREGVPSVMITHEHHTGGILVELDGWRQGVDVQELKPELLMLPAPKETT